MGAILKTNRIFVIDIARFYAIALVFYGHFIEELMLLKNPGAARSIIYFIVIFTVSWTFKTALAIHKAEN